jgi:hypothetical protein
MHNIIDFDILVDANDNTLSGEERGLLEQCRKDRKERPENFTPWQKIRGK